MGVVIWGQSPAKNRAQPRKGMKSRCPGKAMQKRVFTVWNEFSLDWLCVARLTRLLIEIVFINTFTADYEITRTVAFVLRCQLYEYPRFLLKDTTSSLVVLMRNVDPLASTAKSENHFGTFNNCNSHPKSKNLLKRTKQIFFLN